MAESDIMKQTSGTGTDKPFGPAAAPFLAAGIASVVLGILTTLAEASDGVKTALEWSKSVGALSGKAIIEVIVFFVGWAILQGVLKDKDPDPKKVFMWTGILVAVGLVLTFPTFFQAFAPAG